MIILFDGDVLVYKAGFSIETRQYLVTNQDNQVLGNFKYKKEAKEFQMKHNDTKIRLEREIEPIANAFHNLKRIMYTILNRFDTDEYKVYLSPEDTNDIFRRKINPEYKANRKDALKPLYYKELREYLIKYHEAEVQEGIEADDALGINQTDNTVIASIDKDLLMLPGAHYNINTREELEASDPGKLWLVDMSNRRMLKGVGFKWFCAQMLLGDNVDNIKGLKGYGPVKVFNLLENHKEPKDLWNVIIGLYDVNHREDLLLNAKLLWIFRKPNDIFQESIVEAI